MTALLWLALGAAINVGVAWVGAIKRHEETRPTPERVGRWEIDPTVVFARGTPWPRPVPADWPPTADSTHTIPRVLSIETHSSGVSGDQNARKEYFVFRALFGWPARGLECWNMLVDFPVPYPDTYESSVRLMMPWRDGVSGGIDWSCRLPVLPLWPGFALNTLIYAPTTTGSSRGSSTACRGRPRCTSPRSSPSR